MRYFILASSVKDRVTEFFSDNWWGDWIIREYIYSPVLKILLPTAITAAAVCLLLMFVSKNENTVKQARAMLSRIVAAVVVLLLLGLIIGAVFGVIKSVFS